MKKLFNNILIAVLFNTAFILPDGFAQQQVQKPKPVYFFNPRWSPDGISILFESTLHGESLIYKISRDGSNLKPLTRNSSGQPSWSPDGRSIVYYRSENGNLQLYTNDASGNTEKPLIHTNTQDYGAAWSVSGEIAFMSHKAKGYISHSLFSVNADGTKLKRLMDTTYDCMSPQWSPDGKLLMYTRATWTSKTYQTISKEEMKTINESYEIMLRNIADGRENVIVPKNSPFQSPVWSPDGKSVYLKSESDTGTAIYRTDLKGKNPIKVCQIKRKAGGFDISPDEQFIVFEFSENKKYFLYIFDIKKGSDYELIGG